MTLGISTLFAVAVVATLSACVEPEAASEPTQTNATLDESKFIQFDNDYSRPTSYEPNPPPPGSSRIWIANGALEVRLSTPLGLNPKSPIYIDGKLTAARIYLDRDGIRIITGRNP